MAQVAPVWNSSELRGLCCRSYFGPRTCVRGITNMSKCAGLSIRVSPSHPYNANMAGLGWMRERQCVLYMQWWCCVLVIGKVWRIVRFPNRKEISFVRLAQFSFQKEKIATAHILVSMWYHALMQPWQGRHKNSKL